MSEEISVGRTVHYVVDRGDDEGECRPGVVVNTFTRPGGKSAHGSPGLCNMQVFTDMSNDREFAEAPHGHSAQLGGNPPAILGVTRENDYRLSGYVPLVWKTSVAPQHAARVPGTWHWPRECDAMVYPEKGHNHPPGLVDTTGCTACRQTAMRPEPSVEEQRQAEADRIEGERKRIAELPNASPTGDDYPS